MSRPSRDVLQLAAFYLAAAVLLIVWLSLIGPERK